MPRLIPRLLRALERARTRPPRSTRASPALSPRPLQEAKRVFTRPEEVDISPTGRTKSVLLDRKALRLIYSHARYQRSKTLAPYIYVSKSRWEAKQMRGRAPLGVTPREMTQEERSFYANPYLRMLGSPLRQCFHTNWLLPRELLIRMTPMLLPSAPNERQRCSFLPSGLEHPALTPFAGGRSGYLLCNKSVIDSVKDKGSYKRFAPEGITNITMHPLITQQIGHLLRVRVIQELQLLARRLLRRRRLAKPDEPPLLRRLTRAEWNEIKTYGVIPHRNAVAVLVAPPPNKDPESRTRPTPAVTSMPDSTEDAAAKESSTSLRLSVMHLTGQDQPWPDSDELPDIVPPSRVPLYNGVALFPSLAQRAALHAALGEVLKAERTTRLMTASQRKPLDSASSTDSAPYRTKGDQKASHAVLVCSDEKTLLKGDTVPLAIALWRVRMWEGEFDDGSYVDWMAEPPRTA
ncbi:hypothetical protein BV20DRAFT_1048053 [Pilatotrama ljubarskyi]|nr:hypothetical protein BV20DRAFT_1048053 [Pilatotrama ljubarskyi]